MQLDIERAHQALAPRPAGDREDKPRSIIVKFLRYKTKEDTLCRAWGKKKVSFSWKFDHNYPPVILHKRKEYTEAKRALKQRNIRFHTPFPAKLQVFYVNGTRLYQTAEEATTDIKDKGFPVNMIMSRMSVAEQLFCTLWEKAGGSNRRGTSERKHQRETASIQKAGPTPLR